MISHVFILQVFKSRIFLRDRKAVPGTLELVIQLIFEGTAIHRGGTIPFKLLAKP
jgi:hypothetical protein